MHEDLSWVVFNVLFLISPEIVAALLFLHGALWLVDLVVPLALEFLGQERVVLPDLFQAADLDAGFGEEHDGDADEGDEQDDDLNGVLGGLTCVSPHGSCFVLDRVIGTVPPTLRPMSIMVLMMEGGEWSRGQRMPVRV